MTPSLISHTIAGSVNSGASVTSPPIDTRGADKILIAVGDYAGATASVLTDSKGNTRAPLTSYASANGRTRLFYIETPVTDAAHTFGASGANSFVSIAIMAWRGLTAIAFDQQNGAANGGAFVTTISPGSISTPPVDGCLIVSAATAVVAAGTASIGPSPNWHIADQISWVNNQSMGLAFAYLIQGTRATETPTWTESSQSDLTAAIASFKPSTGHLFLPPRLDASGGFGALGFNRSLA